MNEAAFATSPFDLARRNYARAKSECEAYGNGPLAAISEPYSPGDEAKRVEDLHYAYLSLMGDAADHLVDTPSEEPGHLLTKLGVIKEHFGPGDIHIPADAFERLQADAKRIVDGLY